jgi:aspartate 1-decarboxylase
MVHSGDIIIIISYGLYDKSEAREFKPVIVFVDENNKVAEKKFKENYGEIKNF